MVALQKITKDLPYIQKVISPYAVYIHSKEQFETLVLRHKRNKPGTEVVGRLDATGNVAHVISNSLLPSPHLKYTNILLFLFVLLNLLLPTPQVLLY